MEGSQIYAFFGRQKMEISNKRDSYEDIRFYLKIYKIS